MATVGLRDLFRAPITPAAEGKETYGKPVRMAKAIEADLSVTTAEAILYADDSIDEIEKEFVSGEVKLKVNDLTPADLAAVLGMKQDDDGVVYGGEMDDPPYFAIGFRAKKAGGKYKYVWLYKVKFAIPNDKYVTKGDKLEFNTPEITGKFTKRDDGYWKAEHVGAIDEPVSKSWFETVREPRIEPETPDPDPDPDGDNGSGDGTNNP